MTDCAWFRRRFERPSYLVVPGEDLVISITGHDVKSVHAVYLNGESVPFYRLTRWRRFRSWLRLRFAP